MLGIFRIFWDSLGYSLNLYGILRIFTVLLANLRYSMNLKDTFRISRAFSDSLGVFQNL